MQGEELKEYLGMVADLEKEHFFQESAVQHLIEKRGYLCVKKPVSKPKKPEPPVKKADGMEALAVFGGLGVIGVVLLILAWKLFSKGGIDWSVLGFVVGFFGVVVLLLSIVHGIIETGEFFKAVELDNFHASKYEEEMFTYERDMKTYRRELIEEEKRMARETQERTVVNDMIAALETQKKKTQALLEKAYAMDVIYAKYRHFAEVCSMYEYLCSGRCTQLEGHEGAYNILESELRANLIILQLDVIIQKLDSIRRAQYMMYNAIQETNEKISEITSLLKRMDREMTVVQTGIEKSGAKIRELAEKIQANSEIAAYCAKQSQKELSYMNRMNYLAGRNNGSFFNLPPS